MAQNSTSVFVFLFLGIILALLIVRWSERVIDLTVYDKLGISKQNLTANALILFALVIAMALFIWWINRKGLQSVETVIEQSVDI